MVRQLELIITLIAVQLFYLLVTNGITHVLSGIICAIMWSSDALTHSPLDLLTYLVSTSALSYRPSPPEHTYEYIPIYSISSPTWWRYIQKQIGARKCQKWHNAIILWTRVRKRVSKVNKLFFVCYVSLCRWQGELDDKYLSHNSIKV